MSEPKIDGKIEDSEWASASTATYQTIAGRDFTIYVMNDAKYLYIAIKVRDYNLNDIIDQFDQVVIDFHQPNDGGYYLQNPYHFL